MSSDEKPPPTIDLSWLQPVDPARRKEMNQRFELVRDPRYPGVVVVRPRDKPRKG